MPTATLSPESRPKPKRTGRHDARITRGRLVIPWVDWPAICAGDRCEWRTYGRQAVALEPRPRPMLAITLNRLTGEVMDERLFILEDTWVEMLGAISDESLEAEGYSDDLVGFRLAWNQRHPQLGYQPLKKVRVFRLRLWTPDDYEPMARTVMEHLWGEWL